MKNKLVTFWISSSLNKKFLLFTLFIVVFNVIFGVILTSYYTMTRLTDHATKYMDTTLTYFVQQLDSELENIKSISQEILYDETISSALTDEKKPGYDYINHQFLIKDRLRKFISFNSNVSSIGIISNIENIYACDENNALTNYYYKISKDKNRFFLNSQIEWDYDNSNIYLIRQIKNTDTYEELGMMIIVIKNKIISDLCNNANIDKKYVLSIFSKNNKIVFLTNKDYNTQRFDNSFFTNINYSNGLLRRKSTKEFIYTSVLSANSWQIAIIASETMLLNDVYIVFFIFLLFGTAACMIIFTLIKMFSRQLLIPINSIISSITSFKQSNKLDYIPVNTKDELGTLSKMFNEMISHMDYLTQTVYKKRLLNKNLQMRALQSQINPHFIFNALDSINWIARLNKDTEAANMITALSNILRISSGKTKSKISVKKELSYVEDYIYLISERFKDTLKIIRNFIPETLDLEIPSFTIQPILENAIKHGIDHVTRNGIIVIKTYIFDNNLMIEVIDNGIGIAPEKLNLLNGELAGLEDNDVFCENDKIGLINNNQRIKLFYGSEYGFTIKSSFSHYTRVICKIPALTSPDSG